MTDSTGRTQLRTMVGYSFLCRLERLLMCLGYKVLGSPKLVFLN